MKANETGRTTIPTTIRMRLRWSWQLSRIFSRQAAIVSGMAALLLWSSCADRSAPPADPSNDLASPPPTTTPADPEANGMATLSRWEESTRRSTNFAALPSFERISGSNPHQLLALSKTRQLVVLRGSSELAVIDNDGQILSRVASPTSSIAAAVHDEAVWVVGEGSSQIWTYQLDGNNLRPTLRVEVPGAVSLRALVIASSNHAFVADDVSGAIIEARWSSPASTATTSTATTAPAITIAKTREIDRCHAPLQLAIGAGQLVAVCSSDHQLRRWNMGLVNQRRTRPTSRWSQLKPLPPITHDGPIWAAQFVGIVESTGGQPPSLAPIIALTGIENRALDRSDQGSFGYIDSFVFVYQLPVRGKAQALAAINVGEYGLITPKWIDARISPSSSTLTTASYGGSKLLKLSWPNSDFSGSPAANISEFVPGTTSHLSVDGADLYSNPLFDGLLLTKILTKPTAKPTASTDLYQLIPIKGSTQGDPRSTESKLGELIFFTELMAPWSSSTDRRSRFTCEACHFEGYVDGRTHYTGRRDVIATSRPLRGLFNNRPHFSRALDETSTEMVNNEFTVANKLNGRSPWFSLERSQLSWLAHIDPSIPTQLTPVLLRRSLLAFLRDFTHRPNPNARGLSVLSKIQRRGAQLFLDQCEGCHSARLSTDEPTSRVAFADWEQHLLSRQGSHLVWARSEYAKTGVEPYVHKKGARPPTLRRLYKKWPYFTNGSAKTIAAVLDAVRLAPNSSRDKLADFSHIVAGAGRPLRPSEKTALIEFLKLL